VRPETQLNSKCAADAGVNTSMPVSKYQQIINETKHFMNRSITDSCQVGHKIIFNILVQPELTQTCSFTSGLKPTRFTNPTPVVSLLPPGLNPRTIAWTVSS